MEPPYHIACLRAVSGFTQTFAKLNDWKGNFPSPRFVARRVNPKCSHLFSTLCRNRRKMEETSSEGPGGKKKKMLQKGGGMFSCLCRQEISSYRSKSPRTCFQQGAQADINILMRVALTFIKEGSRHISGGAEDGTLRGNTFQSNASWAGICELSCSFHVNQQRPDVSRETSNLKPWFSQKSPRVPSDSPSTVNIVSGCV